jgi:hypothetical protein
LRWLYVDCSMVGMEPQRRAANLWTGVFDRLVTRWRSALGARRALGVEPVEAIVGGVPTTPEAPAARSERDALPVQVSFRDGSGDQSSRSQGSCGLAACSAGSVSASSGPSGTSAVGRWPRGARTVPMSLRPGLGSMSGLEL